MKLPAKHVCTKFITCQDLLQQIHHESLFDSGYLDFTYIYYCY